jgi:nucleoside-diphosphate-sugar epimerase
MPQPPTRYLVTGARGFIGAWICRLLAEEGIDVIAVDASADEGRVAAAIEERHRRHVRFVTGDVTDPAALPALVCEGVTHLIHLAGFLRPASEEHAARSMQVSVGGLLNMLECARRPHQAPLPVVFASTAAVYGPATRYPSGLIAADSPPDPVDNYGIQRYAMEMTARVFANQHGVGSVGLRPWIVYGPGRETGASASPSLALLAAAAGRTYHIRFGGTSVYHHVQDVASAFIRASRTPMSGSFAANIPGESFEMARYVEVIERAAPAMRGKITFEPTKWGSPSAVDDPTLSRFTGHDDWGRAEERVPETIRDYKRLLDAGLVDLALLGA